MLNEMLEKYNIPPEERSSLHITDDFDFGNRTITVDEILKEVGKDAKTKNVVEYIQKLIVKKA